MNNQSTKSQVFWGVCYLAGLIVMTAKVGENIYVFFVPFLWAVISGFIFGYKSLSE